MTPLPTVFADALALIGSIPGYESVASDLARCSENGRLVFDEALSDRGITTPLGYIRIGPEPVSEGTLSLAETLVHEAFHQRQNPLEKTASFWLGLARGADVMARYERPAYRAAIEFLKAVERARPELAHDVAHEIRAIQATYESVYRQPL